MYPRQFKQFLKAAQPDFDERRYGSIADLMRACQKDGILRLERDRQGGLRVFANGATARATVPHGWGLVVNNTQSPVDELEPSMLVEPLPPAIAEPVASPLEVDGNVEAAPKPASKAKKTARAKKTAAPAVKADKKKPAPRKKKG